MIPLTILIPLLILAIVLLTSIILFTLYTIRVRSILRKSVLLQIREDKYHKNMKYDRCAICIDHYAPQENVIICSCSHVFHRKCLYKWLNQRLSCPVCSTWLLGIPNDPSVYQGRRSSHAHHTNMITEEQSASIIAAAASPPHTQQLSSRHLFIHSSASTVNHGDLLVV